MKINGVEVTVTGEPYENEIEGYVREGIKRHGDRLKAMEIVLDGPEMDIHYILRKPFERIRRITGYLQKTEQWNNAKQHELADRVKHGEDA